MKSSYSELTSVIAKHYPYYTELLGQKGWFVSTHLKGDPDFAFRKMKRIGHPGDVTVEEFETLLILKKL